MNQFKADKVYLSRGYIDMRKDINGLAAIVQECFSLDPFSTNLFVFCSKDRTKVKILQWDGNGFWLHYKRLETGKFKWPKRGITTPMQVSCWQLNLMLNGLKLVQQQPHNRIAPKIAI